MQAANPVPIQSAAATSCRFAPAEGPPPPLFLIHDASGTIVSYFSLGPLGRRVYGIYDPRFDNAGGGGWQSVLEMARAYVRLIKKVMVRGNIVLGGWSFGGILAVQIAHLLATEGRGLRVVGIVLMDTVYSASPRKDLDMNSQGPALPGVSDEVRERVLTSLVRATCLCDEWEPPTWNLDAASRGQEKSMAPHARMGVRGANPIAPLVVLIKARDMVPMRNPDEVCSLDKTRGLWELGWEHVRAGFVSEVMETAGNHYTIFDRQNISSTTACLRKALEVF